MKIEIEFSNPLKHSSYLREAYDRFMFRIAVFFTILNLQEEKYQRDDSTYGFSRIDSSASIISNIGIGIVIYVAYLVYYYDNGSQQQVLPLLSLFFTSAFFVVFKLVAFFYILMHFGCRIAGNVKASTELGDSITKIVSFYIGFFAAHLVTYTLFTIVL